MLQWIANMSLVHRIFSHLLVQVAIRSVRSSALTTGAVLMMSSLGAWQYLGSSLHAMDMHYAASVPISIPAEKQVLVIAIDDSAYQNFFGGQSPLRQDRMAKLLETVSGNAIHAQKILVDLDIAPPLNASNDDALEPVLRNQARRWVLASASGSTPADNAQRAIWRGRRCALGVSFGSPMVATDFGYVRTTHQYRGSLSDVAVDGRANCVAPEFNLKLQPAPISPHALKSGTVLPFSGDLDLLAQSLRALDPQWVVVGGTWGKDDVFATPFGDRYGVQVHAAALAGRLAGLYQVPNWVQMVTAWMFVTVVSVILSSLARVLGQWAKAPRPEMPGHQFFETRLIPMILMFAVLFMLGVIGWLLGCGYGLTGIWIPSSTTGFVTLIAVMLIWNWGKADFQDYRTIRDASAKVIVGPVLADLHSARHSFTAFARRPSDPAWSAISRPRLAFEGVMSLVSITLQNVLPLISVLYAIAKPL